ncbi:3-hydroxydecanoyl-(acyl carrier protein) dehydratase [Oleiphilus messinensis]|uniref:3-hydroxydecanoyl-(Acyl carrier protein) dehydratase n=1 Tax=Oleiphilus messinensis TaxID=141451 RepID=A0A1Y0IEJ4_9GAMM|nr:bifunctional 3-hydroxydecanoyl-ACP dehydratase/trans-2-decenoyl-ACP isomerase [Oleiphilus messinensis]ARU57793.1 3-hydroxydecanoyl-(acyl carrier protein) dehydratase [Oleiphilus messinensis]
MLQKSSYSNRELQLLAAEQASVKEGSHIMQLPQGNMKMLDRIVQISDQGGQYGRGELIAEYDVTPDAWFFACHFPGDPVMPGCLGLDGLWQSLGFYLAWSGGEGKGRALGVGTVKFFGEVLPDCKTVRYHLHIKKILRKDVSVAFADGEVFADGVKIYSAASLRVGMIKGNPETPGTGE